MEIKRIYSILILLFIVTSCNQNNSNIIPEINDGLFQSYGNTMREKIIRTGPKWQLKIKGNNGELSYFASNGFRNFNLFVKLSIDNEFVNVNFDSIISASDLASSVINKFKKGDLIFEYSYYKDSLFTNSKFFHEFSSENNLITFFKKSNSEYIEPSCYKTDTSFQSIVKKYLGWEIKKKIIVVPCYNGYSYVQEGYDFNPFLEEKLKEINTISLISFPFKKMQGSGYQSVYDKKYCDEILEKTDVDFLVMTKFTGNLLSSKEKTKTWGYETKVLNVKTMEQIISIKAKNLKSYEAIEKEIEKNIYELVSDFK